MQHKLYFAAHGNTVAEVLFMLSDADAHDVACLVQGGYPTLRTPRLPITILEKMN